MIKDKIIDDKNKNKDTYIVNHKGVDIQFVDIVKSGSLGIEMDPLIQASSFLGGCQLVEDALRKYKGQITEEQKEALLKDWYINYNRYNLYMCAYGNGENSKKSICFMKNICNQYFKDCDDYDALVDNVILSKRRYVRNINPFVSDFICEHVNFDFDRNMFVLYKNFWYDYMKLEDKEEILDVLAKYYKSSLFAQSQEEASCKLVEKLDEFPYSAIAYSSLRECVKDYYGTDLGSPFEDIRIPYSPNENQLENNDSQKVGFFGEIKKFCEKRKLEEKKYDESLTFPKEVRLVAVKKGLKKITKVQYTTPNGRSFLFDCDMSDECDGKLVIRQPENMIGEYIQEPLNSNELQM